MLLAVEVLSPSSGRNDRVRKRALYQKYRVVTYWVVDHEDELVEVWRPGDDRPEIVTDTLRWQLAPDAPALAIDLPALFASVAR